MEGFGIECSEYERTFPTILELINDLIDCGIGFCYYLNYNGENIEVELEYLIGTQYKDIEI